MSEQHPTIPGVTVIERSKISHWTGREIVTRTEIEDDYGTNLTASSLGACRIEGPITLENVETVIAMIRDQAEWLAAQKETK